jgi:hypothetical protein
VDDDGSAFELGGEEGAVAHVSLEESRPSLLGVLQVLPRSGAEIVDRNDVRPHVQQLVDHVASDEAGPARDDDAPARDVH